MNLFTKKKQTHRYRKQVHDYHRESGNKLDKLEEFRNSRYKLLYIDKNYIQRYIVLSLCIYLCI